MRGRGRKLASTDVLGLHERILNYLSLEVTLLGHTGTETVPKAWAVRLEQAPYSSVRDYILNNVANPPKERIRLELAVQFAEGVAYLHQRGIIWGGLSARNSLLFDKWRIKLSGFADSDPVDKYPRGWYGAEMRYCPPGSDRPQCHNVSTINREIFALGTAIYEIVEWKVPYGSETKVSDDEVIKALIDHKLPQMTDDNPVMNIIRQCWGGRCESSAQVVDGLKSLLKCFHALLYAPNPTHLLLLVCIVRVDVALSCKWKSVTTTFLYVNVAVPVYNLRIDFNDYNSLLKT